MTTTFLLDLLIGGAEEEPSYSSAASYEQPSSGGYTPTKEAGTSNFLNEPSLSSIEASAQKEADSPNLSTFATYATSLSGSSSSSSEQAESEALMSLLCYGDGADQSNIQPNISVGEVDESFFQLINTLNESTKCYLSNEVSSMKSADVSAEHVYFSLQEEQVVESEEVKTEPRDERIESCNYNDRSSEAEQTTFTLESRRGVKVELGGNNDVNIDSGASKEVSTEPSIASCGISDEANDVLKKTDNEVVSGSNDDEGNGTQVNGDNNINSNNIEGNVSINSNSIEGNTNITNNETDIQAEKKRAHAYWKNKKVEVKNPNDLKERMEAIIQMLDRQDQAIEKLTERVLNIEQNFPKVFEHLLETKTKALIAELDEIFVKHARDSFLYKTRSANLEKLTATLQMENDNLKALLQQQSNQISWMLHSITHKPSLMMSR